MCNIPYTTNQIKYPNFVDTSKIIYYGNNQFRYSLYIPFLTNTNTQTKHNKGNVVVILKNPSSASQTGCDKTISKVCNAASYNGYSSVIIANLFPYRATNAKQVVNFYAMPNYSQIMQHNLQQIRQLCSNRDVVFAWGTDTIGMRTVYPHNYNNAVISITSNITARTYFSASCCCNNSRCNHHNYNLHPQLRYPLHGLRWHNNSLFIRY